MRKFLLALALGAFLLEGCSSGEEAEKNGKAVQTQPEAVAAPKEIPALPETAQNSGAGLNEAAPDSGKAAGNENERQNLHESRNISEGERSGPDVYADVQDKESGTAATESGVEEAEDAEAGPAGPTDPLVLEKANRILAFSNKAREVLSRGYYAQPDVILEKAQKYLETFRVPPRPRLARRKNAAISTPGGLFDDAEAKVLTEALQDMDKAIAGMIADHDSLLKYVGDSSIRDDGMLGQKLTRKIQDGHAQFMKARDSWLEIMDKRASEAEKCILREHPLRRQILAAQEIFARFGKIAASLKEGEAKISDIAPVRDEMENLLARAGRPPFPAAPALERLYRHFLKEGANYVELLNRAMLEGFHAAQRRELNAGAQKCREAYNEFARAASGL